MQNGVLASTADTVFLNWEENTLKNIHDHELKVLDLIIKGGGGN